MIKNKKIKSIAFIECYIHPEMEVWICLECIGSNGGDFSCHYELECLSSTYQRGVEIVVKSEYFTVSHLDKNGICSGFQFDGPKIPKLTP